MSRAPLSLAEIADVLQGDCVDFTPNFTIVRGIATDSRTLLPGEVFLALKGDRFDGHHFIPQAIAQGAAALIVSDPVAPQSVPVFVVADTLVAYQTLARHWRRQFALPVIGITGSVGKTTTKEIIAAVLGTAGQVHKTQKNFNNEIGVPKTLLELQPDHDYAVVEMAMRGQGEIALLAQIAEPTIGLITNVGTAHIGRLGSEQAIAAAKCELLTHMPTNSLAILNADDARLMQTAAQVWSGRTLTYGLTQGDLRGEWHTDNTLHIDGQVYPLPLPGEHIAANYLAAFAVAQSVGLDWRQWVGQKLTVDLPGGRSQQIQLAEDVWLLDETYNAGYESMVAALKLLKNTPGSRHLAVLGVMKELGTASAQLHRQVGAWVLKLGLDGLFVLVADPEAAAIATTAAPVPTFCCATPAALTQAVLDHLQPGDRVLFKASHAVGLDRVVQHIATTWGESPEAPSGNRTE